MALALEQILNGLQFGVMLFLLAAGLTVVFGIMGLINLAHGSLYMIGAYAAAFAGAETNSILIAMVVGLGAAGIAGIAVEALVFRRLYSRDHLHQVLATFGLILFFNEALTILFGRQPLFSKIPETLSGSIALPGGLNYPIYRLAILAVGIAVAVALYVLIKHTRTGMLVRAGSTHRQYVQALGVNVPFLFTAVFGLGAVLAGLAGAMAGPLLSVQIGMGEQILILTFVVIVIGGIGSIRGAVVGSLLVGLVDTSARAFLPGVLGTVMADIDAYALASSLSSISVYLLMAVVLLWRPRGFFPV